MDDIRFASLGALLGVLGAGALFSASGCAISSTEPTAEADEQLTAAQCAYFDVNGKDPICHYTGSGKHPYTIIKTSDQGCINGHSGHDHDYIAVGDPTCQGGGCLPVNAPCDATLPCCDGLLCQNGTCTDPCASAPCQNDGSFAAPVAYSNNGSGQTAGLSFGDADGDGKLDAHVLRTASAGGVYPMTGNGAGAFSVQPLISTGSSPGLNALATADMNHDAYLDMILTNRGSGTVTVILNGP